MLELWQPCNGDDRRVSGVQECPLQGCHWEDRQGTGAARKKEREMNSKLVSKAADLILGSDVDGHRKPAEDLAEALFKMVLQDVLLPEYNRWRDVDGEIGIGASGALANCIAKLTIGLDERQGL